jgi:hypothetical protein
LIVKEPTLKRRRGHIWSSDHSSVLPARIFAAAPVVKAAA